MKIIDYSVSGEEFTIRWNDKFKCFETFPKVENLEKYYQSDNYISHTDGGENFTDKLYRFVKKYTLKKKVDMIEKFVGKVGRVADIGAGTGDFLAKAREKGWKISGVEPNQKAREKAWKKGVNLVDRIENLEEKNDVVSLWHCLEHIENLEEEVEKIVEKTKDDGAIFVAVPNYKSKDAEIYQKYWAGWDVPRHCWHFNRESIKAIFEKVGWEVVEIKPMVFDSFYVSILSEKYKNKKGNLFRAFFVGLYSNIKAMQSKEWSSLIYIIKKKE